MNKDRLIAAFEDAKQNNVPLITGAYRRDEQCYCAVGYMAKFMGIAEELIHETFIGLSADVDWQNIDSIKKFYGISVGDIIERNDIQWHSWDDAIAWVKAQPDE